MFLDPSAPAKIIPGSTFDEKADSRSSKKPPSSSKSVKIKSDDEEEKEVAKKSKEAGMLIDKTTQ